MRNDDNPMPSLGEIFSDGRSGYEPAMVTAELRLMGHTTESFEALPRHARRKIARAIARRLTPLRADQLKHPMSVLRHDQIVKDYLDKRTMSADMGSMATARQNSNYYAHLMRFLKEPLVLEKPQGSSLHHLLDYDRSYHGISLIESAHDKIRWDDLQSLIVEKEWSRLVSGTDDAEWRLPFEFCCFEFRISGARVLAIMTQNESSGVIDMPILAIGLARHWSCSQFEYEIRGASVLEKSGHHAPGTDLHVGREYKPLVDFIVRQVRAASIVLDAQVTRLERVAPAPGLNRSRARAGQRPVREHRVIRLIKRERSGIARSGGHGGARRPQALHWRRGHYKHYADYDSGEIIYVNDGGFFLSKTWTRWALAGDPDYGIIEKEYRL